MGKMVREERMGSMKPVFFLAVAVLLTGCTSGGSDEDQPGGVVPPTSSGESEELPQNVTEVAEEIEVVRFNRTELGAIGAMQGEPVSSHNGANTVDLPREVRSLEAYLNWTAAAPTGAQWTICLSPPGGSPSCATGSSPVHLVVDPIDLSCKELDIVVRYEGNPPVDAQRSLSVEGFYTYAKQASGNEC